MDVCDHCGSGEREHLFTCNYCDNRHCSNHRLPENHNCTHLLSDTEQYGRISVESEQQSTRWTRRRKILFLLAGGGVAGVAGVLTMPDELSSLFSSAEEGATSAADSVGDGLNSVTEDDWDARQIATLTHEGINSVRSDEGLTQLDWNDDLHQVATDYARRMAEEGFFSHTGPSGSDVGDRYAAAGIDCRVSTGSQKYVTGGENILQTYWETDVETDSGRAFYDTNEGLADGMVQQWMNSPRHRENILQRYWQTEGIGVARNNDRVYAVQNFC